MSDNTRKSHQWRLTSRVFCVKGRFKSIHRSVYVMCKCKVHIAKIKSHILIKKTNKVDKQQTERIPYTSKGEDPVCRQDKRLLMFIQHTSYEFVLI